MDGRTLRYLKPKEKGPGIEGHQVNSGMIKRQVILQLSLSLSVLIKMKTSKGTNT